MVVRRRAGRSRVLIPACATDFYLLEDVVTGSWPTEPAIQWVPGHFRGGKVATATSLLLRESQTPDTKGNQRDLSAVRTAASISQCFLEFVLCGGCRHMQCSIRLTMLSTDKVTFCLCVTLWSSCLIVYEHHTQSHTHHTHTTHTHTQHTITHNTQTHTPYTHTIHTTNTTHHTHTTNNHTHHTHTHLTHTTHNHKHHTYTPHTITNTTHTHHTQSQTPHIHITQAAHTHTQSHTSYTTHTHTTQSHTHTHHTQSHTHHTHTHHTHTTHTHTRTVRIP